MRRAARTDGNQNEIAKALRDVGFSLFSLAAVGKGMGDVLVGYGGRTFLCEIKDGSKPPSARKLTEAQIKFRDSWKGDYTVLESVEDVRDFHEQVCFDLWEAK